MLLSLLPLPGGAQSAEHVVISEVMFQPLGAQPAGEWIEIYNPSTVTVLLTNFKLGDEETAGGGEGTAPK